MANVYRVCVSSRVDEVFEINAEDEEQAASEWFDGALVASSGGEPEITAVTLIDRVEGEQ